MNRKRKQIWTIAALVALVLLTTLSFWVTARPTYAEPSTLPFQYPTMTYIDAAMNEPGEPVNLVVSGVNESELVSRFEAAGWRLVGTSKEERGHLLSDARTGVTPISPRYLLSRQQDLGMQGPNSTILQRDHARFWRLNETLFVGAASRDDGITLVLQGWMPMPTHVIMPDIDDERDAIGRLLGGTRGYTGGVPATRFHGNENEGWYCTDGRILVIALDGTPMRSLPEAAPACSRILVGFLRRLHQY